jgi:hypothetical protein
MGEGLIDATAIPSPEIMGEGLIDATAIPSPVITGEGGTRRGAVGG